VEPEVKSAPNLGELTVADSAEEHAALAGELMTRAIHDAIEARGVARIALSGGTTPAEAYRYVARQRLDWDSTEWFWVDERAVPPDHDRSNYLHALRDLGLAGQKGARVHRMPADEPDLEAAALRYEAELRRSFGVAAAVAFDVMTLGVGDDGHTASLFPGMGSVRIDDRLVAAIPAQPEKKLEQRLTLTAPVIAEARLALVLCRGAGKRPFVEKARASGPEDEIPSRVTQRVKGRLVWVLDRAASPA
jgi:6-phosphogluconolactonase